MNPDPADPASVPRVSVVVIGRNEGARLERCLAAIAAAHWNDVTHEVIYVDSHSSDGSRERAAALGAQVLTVERKPPNAAKARNQGWRAARGEFVLFLDGDTVLHADFVTKALAALDAEPVLCAAWGHRRELDPGQSIYTRLLDLDWIYPTGRALYFGGDVLVRRAALAMVEGFDESLNAGEEPELCARLRGRGWQIEHLDVPMTLHDLAIRSFRPYWLRAYRSGTAYAEVAARARAQGDVLWQRESLRDLVHGAQYATAPLWLAIAAWISPWLFALLLAGGVAVILRTAARSRWKAPDDPWLCLLYAVHVHVQKVPAFFGQLAFRRAAAQRQQLDLIDYKDSADAAPAGSPLKPLLVTALRPVAWLWRVLVTERAARVWHLARLAEALPGPVDASNVILGAVELHGTRNIRFGRGALIYPGAYLETQGAGVIEIGDGVVLSRGVHLVAFERIVLGDGAMIGEYSSLRDANHRLDGASVRSGGHEHAPITVGRNAWIGRGVTVLKGVTIGADAVVAAGAVVLADVPAGALAGGLPARVLRADVRAGTRPQPTEPAA